jgi:hypothetical protein
MKKYYEKILIGLLTLLSLSCFGAEEKPEMSTSEKNFLISDRMTHKLGVVVTEIRYSAPNGFIGNVGRLAAGISSLADQSISMEEVHITTDRGIILNCNAKFDHNIKKLDLLSQCSIYDSALTNKNEALIGALKL